MEGNEALKNTQEREPNILGKVSIMRHGATTYTNKFPDLTEKGINQAKKRGVDMKNRISPDDDVLYATSPSVRAQGTMSFILEESGEKDVDARVLDSIRSVEIRDYPKAMDMVNEVYRSPEDVPKFDRVYANDDKFENTPDVWEPRSDVEGRFYRGLEYVIRSFIKYNKNKENNKIPHLIAVSHFEFLNHFVVKVFGLDLEKDELLGFTEMIEMEMLEPDTNKPDDIPIKVSFRGQSRNIIFNRESRSITVI